MWDVEGGVFMDLKLRIKSLTPEVKERPVPDPW